MEPVHCPSCGASKILAGLVMSMREGGGVCFVPEGTRFLRGKRGIDLSGRFLHCLSCGHLWLNKGLTPAVLREFIRTYGMELTNDWFDALIDGPGHDLPDLPEACEAAAKVAELDALVIADRRPEATRHYRELTGTTWDQAIEFMRHWPERKRAEKLAHFGWQPKAKPSPVPEAREVAGKIAELDALVVADRQPEAIRRYRELTGATWDQAIGIVRRWHDRKFAEKLALLGWQSKDAPFPDCYKALFDGPGHDLPDVPEAREAAAKVAALDALIGADKQPEATRRYRELTGMSWDQAIDVMRHWRELKRAEKLAHFGWQPKGKPTPEPSPVQGHPLHDPELDGR